MKVDDVPAETRQHLLSLIAKQLNLSTQNASKLEERLLLSASSVEEYGAAETLRERLKGVVRLMKEEIQLRRATVVPPTSTSTPVDTNITPPTDASLPAPVDSETAMEVTPHQEEVSMSMEVFPFLLEAPPPTNRQRVDAAAALQDLLVLEDRVLAVLRLAEDTVQELGRAPASDGARLAAYATEVVAHARAVQAGLRTHSHVIRPITQLGEGDYFAQLEDELRAREEQLHAL